MLLLVFWKYLSVDNMIQVSLKDIANVLNAELHGADVRFHGVSINTRDISANNLFIAIKGATFDGHQFIADAKEAGAVAAVVSCATDIDIPHIVVPDTTLAMGQIAKFWREQVNIPFIGITGSCGKTTTTQMTGAILNQVSATLVPKGNKNNQWGVPITLFRLSAHDQFAVIEMGADRPGEIKYLTEIVQPNVSIITNVAPVHLEVSEGIGFDSIDGVFKEKSEIFRTLSKDGTAIVCADDTYFPQWQQMLSDKKLISFGLSEQANVRATNLQANSNMQYRFDLVTPQGNIAIQLSSLGRHNVVNALAAAAACLAVGVSLEVIQLGLADVPVVSGRMIKMAAKNGAVLIDDSYNSNVRSANAVLDMLHEQAGKTIAILGDMLEMGVAGPAAHRQVGEYAKSLHIDHFFALGEQAKSMAEGFGAEAKHFMTHEALIATVMPLLDEDTILVVKGSFGMSMDKIVIGLKK
jgi:UDP-N-acetylmuramoyl-tripeptide--D-alanyl-D-alanine ligase